MGLGRGGVAPPWRWSTRVVLAALLQRTTTCTRTLPLHTVWHLCTGVVSRGGGLSAGHRAQPREGAWWR